MPDPAVPVSGGTVARRGSLGNEGQLIALSAFDAPRHVAAVGAPVGKRYELAVASVELPPIPESIAELDITGCPRIAAPSSAPEPLPAFSPPVSVARKVAERYPAPSARWPYPGVLLRQLEELTGHAESRSWAEAAMAAIQEIQQSSSLCSTDIKSQLATLDSAVREAERLAKAAANDGLRTLLLRAKYALERRILVWNGVTRVAAGGMDTYTVSIVDGSEVTRRLDAVEKRLAGSQRATAWTRYLLVDELRQAAGAGDADQQRRLARRVLARLETPQMSAEQTAFLKEEPLAGLSTSLRAWAGEPVDYLRLLDDVEIYEETLSTSVAGQLAQYYQILRWSPQEDVKQLAESLNTHYRNANLRVVMTADFLNRLLPQSRSFDEEVDDHLLGARVLGTSRTLARLRVVLFPDARRWRLGLEAEGNVESETASTRGPATFYSDGFSRYLARKLLMIDRQGVHTWETEAEADTNLDLRGVETQFDEVPFLGWMARTIAVQQHARRSNQARWTASARLERLASERMDREVQRQIQDVEQDFRSKWLNPLKDLKLKPAVMDMQTTSDRLLVRYRLAGSLQLGAHTPRPEPPQDSLLSVQIHESALNNTLQQLELGGKRRELRQLHRELAAAFGRTDVEIPEDVPEGVFVQFADRSAVSVRCDDNRVTLTLRIAELKNERGKTWKNFAVRAYYVPDAKQLDANLVREGYIELVGQRLSTMDQIALRGIFTKVLSRNRSFNLINKQLVQNPQLSDVAVTQFVVHDGWVGVALGSKSPRPVTAASPPSTAGDCTRRTR